MCATGWEEREFGRDSGGKGLKVKATWRNLFLNSVIDTVLLVTVSEADLSRILSANPGFSKEPLVLR